MSELDELIQALNEACAITSRDAFADASKVQPLIDNLEAKGLAFLEAIEFDPAKIDIPADKFDLFSREAKVVMVAAALQVSLSGLKKAKLVAEVRAAAKTSPELGKIKDILKQLTRKENENESSGTEDSPQGDN